MLTGALVLRKTIANNYRLLRVFSWVKTRFHDRTSCFTKMHSLQWYAQLLRAFSLWSCTLAVQTCWRINVSHTSRMPFALEVSSVAMWAHCLIRNTTCFCLIGMMKRDEVQSDLSLSLHHLVVYFQHQFMVKILL